VDCIRNVPEKFRVKDSYQSMLMDSSTRASASEIEMGPEMVAFWVNDLFSITSHVALPSHSDVSETAELLPVAVYGSPDRAKVSHDRLCRSRWEGWVGNVVAIAMLVMSTVYSPSLLSASIFDGRAGIGLKNGDCWPWDPELYEMAVTLVDPSRVCIREMRCRASPC
jgi:hypothetical protein